MTENTQQPQNPNLPLNVHAQYIKDMSFENPNAPESLKPSTNKDGAPQMAVNVNFDSNPLADKGFFEVVLHVEATATRGDSTMFIAEIKYGVVCSVADNVPEQHIHPLIMIETPKLAFPFVRQILCDAVMAGGFPPLMLNPVDFEGLYMAQYKREKAAEANDEGQGEK